jgi:hypothetical protein
MFTQRDETLSTLRESQKRLCSRVERGFRTSNPSGKSIDLGLQFGDAMIRPIKISLEQLNQSIHKSMV